MALNVQTAHALRFGEGSGPDLRCFVIFDGLHYDPLEMVPTGCTGGEGGASTTTFGVHDQIAMAAAMEFVVDANRRRQFTDTAGFSVRCLTCNTPLKGEAGAQDHAKKTGHTNFGEV